MGHFTAFAFNVRMGRRAGPSLPAYPNTERPEMQADFALNRGFPGKNGRYFQGLELTAMRDDGCFHLLLLRLVEGKVWRKFTFQQ